MNNITVRTSSPESPTAAQSYHSHQTATSPVAYYNNSDVITVWVLNIFKASSGCSSENMADLRANSYWIPVNLTQTSPITARKILDIQQACSASPIDTIRIHNLAKETLTHVPNSPFQAINRRRSLS